MSKSPIATDLTSHHTIPNNSFLHCCGPVTPTTNNMLSSGLTNSASEKPLSESSATSCPHISGVVAEFWTWLDDPANVDWAISTFPVEKGYSDRNIFVSKLPPTFNDRDLQAMFGNFGEVVSAKVMLNVATGASKETGFVQFATAKDALRARAFLRLRPALTEPMMPEVGTQWAQNKHDGGVYGDRSRLARKLFIRNIPVSVTNEEMRALVTRFGEVAEVTLHADTYDVTAAAAAAASAAATAGSGAGSSAGTAANGSDSAAEAEETRSGEVVTPPSPKRTMRICFVTFIQPGVAARACAAIHNTKPFRTCGEVPLMAKIAEDNNARQARHQQGAMHRSDIRHAAIVAASGSGATSPSTAYASQMSPQNSSNHSHNSSSNTAPMMMSGNGLYPYPQPMLNNGNVTGPSFGMESALNGGMPGMVMQPQPQQPQPSGYAHALSPNAPAFHAGQGTMYGGSWCGNQTMAMAQGNYNVATTTAAVTTPSHKRRNSKASHGNSNSNSNSSGNGSAGRATSVMTRLSFQPQNPHAMVSALDPDALAAAPNTTPRVLSTTASPSMNLPAAPNPHRADLDSRRPSRLTLTVSSTTSSSKMRIPATTTSAPTSARRASRDMLAHSPLRSFASERARTTSLTLSNSVSGVYATSERQSSPRGVPSTTVQQQQQVFTPARSASQTSRSHSTSAAAAAVATVAARTISPRPSHGATFSSQSSDTANSRDSGSHDDGAHSRLNVHVNCATRQRRSGQKFTPPPPQQQQQQQQPSHGSPILTVAPSSTTQESSLSSPYMTSHFQQQQQPLLSHSQHGSPLPISAVTMTTAALTIGPGSQSTSRSGWEVVSDEAIVSPYSPAAYAGSHNTPNVTPTRMGNSSQTRYRNNPYGMSIVVEKTRSTSFADA